MGAAEAQGSGFRMTGKTRGAVGLDSSLEEDGLKGRQRMSPAGEDGGLEASPEHQPLLAGVSGGQDTFAQGSRLTRGQGLSMAQEKQALGWLWCSQVARAVRSLGAAVDRSGVGGRLATGSTQGRGRAGRRAV